MGRRFAAVALVLSLLCLAVGAASSLAGSSPPSTSPPGNGPFAQFLTCLKANGAPTFGRPGAKGQGSKGDKGKKDNGMSGSPFSGQGKGSGARDGGHDRGKLHGWLSDADRAALKKAFDACKNLLPKPKQPPAGAMPGGHTFTLPTPAQLQAFKSCMADKGFAAGQPGSSTRPDLRDPAVRTALKNALKACAPLLKPASTG